MPWAKSPTRSQCMCHEYSHALTADTPSDPVSLLKHHQGHWLQLSLRHSSESSAGTASHGPRCGEIWQTCSPAWSDHAFAVVRGISCCRTKYTRKRKRPKASYSRHTRRVRRVRSPRCARSARRYRARGELGARAATNAHAARGERHAGKLTQCARRAQFARRAARATLSACRRALGACRAKRTQRWRLRR